MTRTSAGLLLLTAALCGVTPLTGQVAAGVDDARLRNAQPAEWLSYGRDYAETHYSPLSRINASNVDRIELAWTYETRTDRGTLEATPVVVDGVIYATGTYSVIFALDARTGAEIWRWDPAIVRGGRAAGGPSACCGPVNRGVAVYQGKVYAGLLDGRLVALDAETGDPVWVRQTTPPGSDYASTGAPRIVEGMVIIGNAGAEYGVRGYVTAYDAETGDQIWRFYTVPGDPALGFESPAMEAAAETWSGEWWKLGGGGTVWDGMAYDPEADLLYIGTGNGSPWSRDHRSPGGGDNLYLSSIVALRPNTGEMVWFYQTTPGDDWDYTATQNIILADLVIGGQERKVLMQAPKNGFFYVIDRLTGELLSAEAFAQVSWATGIDLETGRPIEAPGARYDANGSWLMPGPLGAHNWYPMSYSPRTGLVYIPGQNTLQHYRRNTEFQPEPGRFNTGTGGAPPAGERPPNPEPAGYLLAWDPATQTERWRIPYSSGRNGGTLVTAGDVVFSGRFDGALVAHHAQSGELLGEWQLAPGVATPVTWEMDGRQYVTVLAGGAVAPGGVWTFVLDE